MRRNTQQALAVAHADRQAADVVEALLGLLDSQLLPPLSLQTVGWLLHRLLSVGKGAAPLTGAQRAALAAAAARQHGALQQLLQGQWCDALSPLVAAEWGRSRQAILRDGPGSVHVAVQTWMQVGRGTCARHSLCACPATAGSVCHAGCSHSSLLRGHPLPPQAVLVQELQWQQGAAAGGPGGLDPSAVGAKQVYLTVQAAVAVRQLELVSCWAAGLG